MSANQGKANRLVIELLIKDLNKFNDIVDDQLRVMVNKANALGESWNDPQYRQFEEFIMLLNDSIRKDLDEFNKAKDDLERKLSLYD